MCTIGTVILGPDSYLLFKNKDFGQEEFGEQLISTADLFATAGVETFAETDNAKAVYSGLSIGANSHGLLCCDAHVSFEPEGGKNYDLLVEVALTKGQDVPTAISALEAYLCTTSTWAGNLVLTDGEICAAVEAKGHELTVTYSPHHATMTNHQLTFPMGAEPASDSSLGRFQSADQRLQKVTSAAEVFALLRSHDDGQTGVCNHLEGRRTVYSYVLQVDKGETRLFVTNRLPCQTEAFQELPLPLGSSWSEASADSLKAAYPR
ncbi:carcinine hydrolase/isopenicillin-N N-acyltransferase family protein [Rhodovibrionaceae bacterium A322]